MSPDFENVEISLSGVFLKQFWLVRDGEHDAAKHHRHDSDHVTALALGTVRVMCDGVDMGERHAPTLISIPAGSVHSFAAVSPQALMYCIHRLDEGQERPTYEVV